jgi:hypothetical protein
MAKTPKAEKPLLKKSEVKWCGEAERRSDRSLLTTLAKMKAEPDKVREYHYIAYNEMCFRGIESNATPSLHALATVKGGSSAEKQPAKQKDFGPGWIEGAVVKLNRPYGAGTTDVEGVIVKIWNDDFITYDMDVRIKPLDPKRPMVGIIGCNRDELMLLPNRKVSEIHWYDHERAMQLKRLDEQAAVAAVEETKRKSRPKKDVRA